jgi:hypothetical protein
MPGRFIPGGKEKLPAFIADHAAWANAGSETTMAAISMKYFRMIFPPFLLR